MMVMAAFIKGAVGFGFPATATPLMALFLDGKTVIGMLILPNIVMDAIQAVRLPGIFGVLNRHLMLYILGVLGTFVGTRLLATFSPNTFLFILGTSILVFVGVNLGRVSFTVSTPASSACRCWRRSSRWGRSGSALKLKTAWTRRPSTKASWVSWRSSAPG